MSAVPSEATGVGALQVRKVRLFRALAGDIFVTETGLEVAAAA
ncbi:hypothetical protein [Rhodoblastus sp.]